MQTASELLIKYQVSVSNMERHQTNLELNETKLQENETALKDWNHAKILLELLKNFKLEKRKEFILKVINQALVDIFESDYRLDILPRDTKGKSAASTQKYDIIFFQNGIEIAKNDELLSSNGGGVLSIASLFFKILIGYLYSKNKFYIFDEALSQVSPQFRERLSLFLKEFCRRYDFTLVVVSQTEELEEHADLVYEVYSEVNEKGVPVLKQAPIAMESPTENYFYTEIKNFQSIVDSTFIFKGFTIIRGPNNSGKSATLRAIEAIIFNNFKVDTYPRKNPSGKKLTTEITFGFQGKKDTLPKEIGLKYKSGKVMFVIEGEEYFGKSLAADKLREAVEEIGFRYIDVKKMYKNFKGPLKEQTERIAYTNQYDGLFLIGSKTSDSEKIFSFLFNTENIALAIAQSKEALQDLNQESKELQSAILGIKEHIRITKIEIDFYLKQYYFELLKEYQHSATEAILIKQSTETQRNLIERYQKIVLIFEALKYLDGAEQQRITIQNKIKLNNTIHQQIDTITNTRVWLSILREFFKGESQLRNLKEKGVIVTEMKSKIQVTLDLFSYWDLQNSIQALYESKKLLDNKKKELNSLYHLRVCHTCHGIGVEPL